MNPNFVDTNYTNRVIRSVRESVNENAWLAVFGQVGAGKTTLFEKLKHFYKDHPSKFTVIDLQRSFESFSISINFIMKMMIQELAPDASIPGNAHAKLAILKELLLSESAKRKKIILMLDEAQVLKLSLLRDLKKIHEISSPTQSNLFSIIMFGKNEGPWVKSLRGNEIGLRVRKTMLETLKRSEVLDFANRAFNLSWESGDKGEKAKQIFLKHVGDNSPLVIRDQISKLKRNPIYLETVTRSNQNGVITYELAKSVFPQSIGDITKKNGITLSLIGRRFQEMTGRPISKTTISNVLAGESTASKIDSTTSSNILDATLDIIRERSKSDTDFSSAQSLVHDMAMGQ